MSSPHVRDGWTAIEATVHRDTAPRANRMLPVWSLTAVYDGPDGQVPMPAGYDQPDGAAAWFAAHASTAMPRRQWYYFEDRHPDTRYTTRHQPCHRHSARPASQTYGDTQRDWDHVMETRDRILTQAGLSTRSAPMDLARAIGQAVYTHWRGGGPRNHPADVLTHRAWCAGAANATIAMLESLDIPARLVYTLEHAVCEAWLQGGWRVIDSSHHFINHPPTSDHLLPTDFMSLTTHPTAEEHGPRITPFHRGVFYHYGRAFYGPPDGRWFNEAQHRLCPAFAQAYYPGHHAYRFKTSDPTRLTILDRSGRVMGGMDWLAGQALRESVCLGDLSDVRHLEFEMAFRLVNATAPAQADLAQLELRINDQPVIPTPLDQGGLPTGPYDTRLWRIAIPTAAFCPHAINWLTLRKTSTHSILHPALNIASLEPYIPPLFTG